MFARASLTAIDAAVRSWLDAARPPSTTPVRRRPLSMRTNYTPPRLQHAFLTVAVLSLAVFAPSPSGGQVSTATSVRLRGSATAWAGRVEVLYDKQWGTICDIGWDVRDANVSNEGLRTRVG